MPQPKVITTLWNRVVGRPIVLSVAILAAIDWCALVLLSMLGHVDAVVTAALVVSSMGAWFLVLAWYPLLPWFLRGMFGDRGERAGHFFEQMGIGMLAGLHVLWAIYVLIIAF